MDRHPDQGSIWDWGRGYPVLIAAGGIAALGQAPWGLWPLTLLALGFGVARLGLTNASRRAFFQSLALGFGYFAVALHWIFEPFLVDVARHGWMAPFAVILMALGGGLFWAVGIALVRWLGRDQLRLFAICCGLMLGEMARSFLFTGFPWALLGHIWIETLVAQAAAWGGPHALTAITLLIVLGLSARSVLGAALAVILGFAMGFVADVQDAEFAQDDAPIVRLVQPNAEQHLKWEPGYAEAFFDRAVALTASGAVPDLVIWPETSLMYPLESEGARQQVAAASRGAPTIVGALRTEGQTFYNTLAVIGADGSVMDRYDKSHLVPFGEYIPFMTLLGRLGVFDLTQGWTYGSGTGAQTVDIPGFGPALPAICYEYIFANEMNAAAERANVMIFITNDAWFGNYAGPEQHMMQARLRAIEQRLPALRAANTGISAIIDARGGIRASLALNQEGVVDAPLPAALEPSLYVRFGDWPIGLCFLVALGALTAAPRWKRIDPGNTRQ